MKALRVLIDLDTTPARDDVAATLEEIAECIRGGEWEAQRAYGWWNVRHLHPAEARPMPAKPS